MSSSLTGIPDGQPSTMTPRPLPWDSPKVVMVNSRPKVFAAMKIIFNVFCFAFFLYHVHQATPQEFNRCWWVLRFWWLKYYTSEGAKNLPETLLVHENLYTYHVLLYLF